MVLSFDGRARYDTFEHRVDFAAKDGDSNISCCISIKALELHFGLQGDPADNALSVFQAHRQAITSAAVWKYERTGAPIQLVAADFPATRPLPMLDD